MSLERVARRLDEAALAPGDGGLPPRESGWDDRMWAALVRARRLRVLEWLAASGLSILNVLDASEECFLDVAARVGVADKALAARCLWEALERRRPIDPWIEQVGRVELLLVAARVGARHTRAPTADGMWTVSPAVVVDEADPRAMGIHERLPQYDVAEEERPHVLRDALSAAAGAPQPTTLLAAPASELEDGAILMLDSVTAGALARLRREPAPLDSVLATLGRACCDELRALRVLVPW